MEVINVWSGSVSTSWHGCAPPVTESLNVRDNEMQKFRRHAAVSVFIKYSSGKSGKSLKYTSPLKTTLELWLSQQRLRPNALIVILLLTVLQANSNDIQEGKKVDRNWINC